MAKLEWDKAGDRQYETGSDRGVLYLPDGSGVYSTGVPWNGLTTVTETPSGAESNPQYADNIKYVDIQSAEEFGFTVEAFTYPDEFEQCDGTATINGIQIGQQNRLTFGMSYRSRVGNDLLGDAFGYKIHLLYSAKAAPSERAYSTINDSPEPINFSWECTTTPVGVGTIAGTEYKPTALVTVDTTRVPAAAVATLENIIYGSAGVSPRLPAPADVIALFAGAVTVLTFNTASANAPTYNSSSHVVTIPAVTGVTWRVNGVVVTPGAQTALQAGQTAVVTATPNTGYALSATSVNSWSFAY